MRRFYCSHSDIADNVVCLKDKEAHHIKNVLRFKKGDKIGISVDPSDCDDINAPQKVLMSSSINRAWGDPTTFGFLELE